MKIKKRNNMRWHGVKWIDTKFARTYHAVSAMYRMHQVSALSHGRSMARMVNSSPPFTGSGLAEKNLATAEIVVATMKNVASIEKARKEQLSKIRYGSK